MFCDGCDKATHQGCYGIAQVPEGNWYCQVCQVALGIDIGDQSSAVASNKRSARSDALRRQCVLCPNHMLQGGMKRSKDGDEWAHTNCIMFNPALSFQGGARGLGPDLSNQCMGAPLAAISSFDYRRSGWFDLSGLNTSEALAMTC